MTWRAVVLICLAWFVASGLTALVVAAVLRGGATEEHADVVDR